MAAPRWKTALDNALKKHPDASVLQFGSLDRTSPVPHVRTLIFRGFETDSVKRTLLLMTTDIRTAKTVQIIANPAVQLAWWIPGTKEQYRISGQASLVPSPEDDLHKHFTHHLGKASNGFDWEAKRLEVFKSMSGHMKASWLRPPPGTPLSQWPGSPPESWPSKIEGPNDVGEFPDEEQKRLWAQSLRNFALVVVDPEEVDLVELEPIPNRRTRFWKAGGDWEDEALVP
ncbi:hypothetical protein CYLTODRAFT_439684 [Cylindrobasidium torrendii FP15055 ss-10]|uniref:Pyridoxamine 5'-phosphate oxidase Alr4036 family FMN-binding domain-containing protein n=1 Tax=Cylindrobasidium torrendii FP15055 ss-10 TaxID=1314674 RepID=A0A0D7BU10_9AGAR|nr:hypothetical protein CYLTODRAFT_439684 [Cylindrobasidium torrendii FP15055 ss-10]